jgi:hypothetical protein
MNSGFFDVEYIPKTMRRETSVDCFDFDAWCARTLKYSDKNVLKMDIEGAEFDILTKLLDSGAINLFREIWIEEHVTLDKSLEAQRRPVWNRFLDWSRNHTGVKIWMMPP